MERTATEHVFELDMDTASACGYLGGLDVSSFLQGETTGWNADDVIFAVSQGASVWNEP
jgi:hypothetical protein